MKIVTTHKNTDFDALASLVAATLIYPETIPVLPGAVNPNLKGFLSIHKDLFDFYDVREVDLERVTSLIVVDTSSWHRLDGMGPLRKKKDLPVVVWDHHIPDDIDADEEVREETGATITLFVRELERQRKLITPIQATLFLMGLYEDTGNLTFPTTLADDARAAAWLLERKADLSILSSFLKQAYGRKQKDILFRMIQDAERIQEESFSISISKIDIEGHVTNLSTVVQMYREIVNVDAAFGIFRDKDRNRCMVIGRSTLEELNIGVIMRSLGGGGHPGAGSALLKDANPDAVEELILEMVRGNQHSSVMLSDLMSYPVVTVSDDTSMEEVASLLRDMGCTGLPVVDSEERLVGIVSRRDFRRIKKDGQLSLPVKAFMSRDVVTISHDRSAIEAARLMIKNDIGRLPVMQNDRVIGIVTRSDAMLYFYDLLPD